MKEKIIRHENIIKIIAYSLLTVAYCLLTYITVTHQIVQNSSDYGAHASIIFDTWNASGVRALFETISYPGWHLVLFALSLTGLSIPVSIGIATAIFNGLTAAIVFAAFDRHFKKYTLLLSIIAGCIVLFVTAIYLPSFNEFLYRGQGSPTIWHNPTYIAVKPAALLAILLSVSIIKKGKVKLFEGVALAIIIGFSIILKPTFFQVFFPSIVVFLIYHWIVNRDMQFIKNWFFIILPSLAFMLFQYFMLFGSSESESTIAFTFFWPWNETTPNVLISIILLLAFIIFVGIICRKEILSEKSAYVLPTIFLIVGLLEISFLTETGYRAYHGNMGWGYSLSAFIAWFFYLELFIRKAFIEKTLKAIFIAIGTSLIVLHAASGAYFYVYLLSFSGDVGMF